MATRRQTAKGTTTDVLDPDILEQERRRLEETPELPKRSTTSKNQVTVEFNVTVPEGTDALHRSVFLAGTLHQLNSHLQDWDPHGLEMSRVDHNHWTIAFTGPANTSVEYKYTLGSWDHVEKDAHCSEIGNRRVTLSKNGVELQQINDHVQTWRGEGGCGK